MRLYEDLTEERTLSPEQMISATATEILRHLQISVPPCEEEITKKNLIQKILDQIEYRSAHERGAVSVEAAEISAELQQLSARTLAAWYEAFLLLRSEWMAAGQELQGFRVLDRPAAVLRRLLQSDPQFDTRQYIF